jgi:hypothetical protein
LRGGSPSALPQDKTRSLPALNKGHVQKMSVAFSFLYNDVSSSLLFLREVPVHFDELRISRINPRDPKALYQLVVTDLCGERYHREFEDLNLSHIQAFIAISSVEGLNYEQFNELLLLFEQDRISPSFFEYFFASNGRIRLDALASSIAHFRGLPASCSAWSSDCTARESVWESRSLPA